MRIDEDDQRFIAAQIPELWRALFNDEPESLHRTARSIADRARLAARTGTGRGAAPTVEVSRR